MKMTLVIDSEDLDGIRDSFKIIKMMNDKYNTPVRAYNDRSFGKIKFIKLLRRYAKSSQDQDFDVNSLKAAKRFADSLWAGDFD
jgi:hypothetical protein